MGADPRLAGARYLVEFLKHRCISEVSTRDLFQKVKDKSHFETMDKLESVLEVLEEYGYVRKRAQPGGEKGGRPKSPMLEINPLSSPQNPRNPRNPDANPARAFFEWLERRRSLRDAEELSRSEPSSEPVPNERAPEDSARTDLAEAHDSRESDTGEEPNRKSGHEDAAADQSTSESELEMPGNYELVTEAARLSELTTSLQEAHEVALDVETTGLSPREHRVRLLTLATEHGTWVVDCFTVDPRSLFSILAQKRLLIQNALFDLGMLLKMGFEMGGGGEVVDVMLLSQVLKGPRPTDKEDN